VELRDKTSSVRFREDMFEPDGSAGRRMGTLKELSTRRLARRRADEMVPPVNRLDYPAYSGGDVRKVLRSLAVAGGRSYESLFSKGGAFASSQSSSRASLEMLERPHLACLDGASFLRFDPLEFSSVRPSTNPGDRRFSRCDLQ